jgi:hypothetical protein
MKKLKKLKKLSDLPEWFDICKYDKASSLGLKEWYEQISKRVLMQVDYDDGWTPSFSKIKIDPILKKEPIPDEFLDFVTANLISTEPEKSICNFKFSDLRKANLSLNFISADSESIAYGRGEEINMDTFNDDPKRPFNMGNASIDIHRATGRFCISHIVPLTANLQASDEQLSYHFKSWLTQARKDYGCKAKEEMFTHIDFDDWYKYAILPYFDLTTWAKLKNSEFTNAILSEAIFPNAGVEGFDGESRVRRETKRRSEEVFNPDTMYGSVPDT